MSEKTAQQIEANNLALRKLTGRTSECPKATGKPLPAKDDAEPKTS